MYNLAQAERFFRGWGLTIVVGSQYLGIFIGNNAQHLQWLGEKLKDWLVGSLTISAVSRKHLQADYEGLQKSLQ